MIELRISLIYLIVHLLCVVYIFFILDSAKYQSDDFDKVMIWSLAPILVIVMLVRLFLKGGK